jgi:hypothetical protein
MWIRPSTGRLCIEIMPRRTDYKYRLYMSRGRYHSLVPPPLAPKAGGISSFDDEPLHQSKILGSLSFKEYHQICATHLSQYRLTTILSHESVKLGAIYYCTSQEDQHTNWAEIACIPTYLAAVQDDGWELDRECSVMENGWTRCAFLKCRDGPLTRS